MSSVCLYDISFAEGRDFIMGPTLDLFREDPLVVTILEYDDFKEVKDEGKPHRGRSLQGRRLRIAM